MMHLSAVLARFREAGVVMKAYRSVIVGPEKSRIPRPLHVGGADFRSKIECVQDFLQPNTKTASVNGLITRSYRIFLKSCFHQ